MLGTELLTRMRRILRDVETDTVKGEFWHDAELMFALNAAQSLYVNYCIRKKDEESLSGLLESNIYTASPSQLPDDYLHYSSAQVGTYPNLKVSKLYLGGNACPYLNVSHTATFILGDNIYFWNSDYYDAGILYYYKQPSAITVQPVSLQDFPEFIYKDVILNRAVFLIGMKETQTQREFKKMKEEKIRTATSPKEFLYFVEDFELLESQMQVSREPVPAGNTEGR